MRSENGAVLLALVVLMVIVSFLGAAMTHQTATGELSPITGNRSQQAYYLAESGYRYAAAKMKSGAELNDLHDHAPYVIGDKGSFQIDFYTYIFDAQNSDGAGVLTATVPFGDAPSISLSADTGEYFYLKTANNTESFNTIAVNDDTIWLTKNSGNWNVIPSERVRLAVKSNGDVLIEGGDLILQATSPADAFPLRHGRILVDEKVYRYKIREASKLSGVTRADNQAWETPALYNGADIVLLDFLEMHSIGTSGIGSLAMSREIVYSIPVYGSDKMEFHDPFDDKSHWEETSTLGSHIIKNVGGDNVLQVESTTATGPYQESRIVFQPSTTDINFSKTHRLAGDFLRYDSQLKIGFHPSIPDHYMAGITFRLNTDTGEHFGVSFQRPDYDYPTGSDSIPDDLVPNVMQNQYGIVLWQKIGSVWEWLAYKKLIPVTLFADDMENGASNWVQTDTWAYTAGGYNSSNSRTDSPSGNYSNNLDTSIISKTLDLSGMTGVSISFYHRYSIEPRFLGIWTDFGTVEISNDNGATWTELERFTNWYAIFGEISQSSWKNEKISILDSFLTDQVKIRFRLQTDSSVTRDGWYIDDVRLLSDQFPENDATLLVRILEAATIEFTNGTVPEIKSGDILVSQLNATRGVVAGEPIVFSGSWAGGDAAGIIRLNNLSAATFPNGSADVVGTGTNLVNVSGFRERDNYMQVYYGDTDGFGFPNDDPLDFEKASNPRITSAGDSLKWPPDNAEDTDSSNDYYTLVQWDGYNNSEVFLFGDGKEEGTIIRTDRLTTGPGFGFDSEIALHSFGRDIYSTYVYFDDFGIRINVPISHGFLPSIQE